MSSSQPSADVSQAPFSQVARLLGFTALNLPPCDPVEVTVHPASQSTHLSGIRVRRSGLVRCELCRRRGLLTTSI